MVDKECRLHPRNVEGEFSLLSLAIDPLAPAAPLIDSLRALRDTFPDLPVSFSTEGVGGVAGILSFTAVRA